MTTKYDQDPDPDPDLHGPALVLFCIDVKSWILIRINTDPQHWRLVFGLHK
jgi:hypothetical protein